MKLFEVLEKRDISRYRLSQATGIPQSTFSKLKSKKYDPMNLTLESAFKIADYLGMSIEEIFKD